MLNINENPGKNGVEMSQVLFEDINSKINIIKDKIEKNKSIDKNGEQIVEMKYKDLENNLFNEIEKLKAKILNSVDRERKDEYESQLKLEEKKKEVSKLFEEKLKKIKEEKYKEILDDFKSKEKEFCMKEISKFDKKFMKNLIMNILRSEKVVQFELEHLIERINLDEDSIKDIEHLNIILVGPTGVGKTTLINELLGLNLKTGFGLPQTIKIEYYSSDKIPFLRLADSRGIEKNNESGVKETKKLVKEFINSLIKSNDYDKYIHSIWYCWTGTRLEQCEVELLKELSKEYSVQDIPILIVYTNSFGKDDVENAKKYIKEELKLENEFIDVIAKEKTIMIGNEEKIVKPKNLDLLIQKSIELAKTAVKSSIYQFFINLLKLNIQIKIDDLKTEIKSEIKEDIKNILKSFGDNSEIKDLKEPLYLIILNAFYKYFLLKPDAKIESNENPRVKFGEIKFQFSERFFSELLKFIAEYLNHIMDIYEINLKKCVKEYAKNLSLELVEFQNQFNRNNNNLLMCLLTSFEFESTVKNDIMNLLQKKVELTILKNSFLFIIEHLLNKINEYFDGIFKKEMEQRKFYEKAIGSVKISFDKIEQNIKKYNQTFKNDENINPEQGIKNDDNNDKDAPMPFSSKKSVMDDLDTLFDNTS